MSKKDQLRVGLTGGIGSGKSTVRLMFEGLNIPCLDADLAGKQLVQKGQAGLNAIAETFGSDFLLDGELNRDKLRQLIFSDPEAKLQLEQILHPLIRQKLIEDASQLDTDFCIIEVPLLFETQPDYIDKAIVVDCDPQTQIQRTQQRSKLTATEIRTIMQQQATREQRLSIADWVIDSDQPLEKVQQQVKTIEEALYALSRHQ